MRLTFAQAKIELASFAPAAELDRRINRAVEKILLHGKFAGSMHDLALVAHYGQIVLPRYYRTIEGVKVGGVVYDIVNHWWQYLQGKSDLSGFSMRAVRDLNDGWANMYTLPIGGSIQVSYTGDEVIDVTLYGTDSEGFPINLRISGNTTVDNPFVTLDRIQKEKSIVPVKINQIPDDLTGDDFLDAMPIAWMDPAETDTYYRRYIIDSLTATAETQIEAICKLRHITLVEDDDVLPIHNLNAMELAMTSLQYYKEDDVVRAQTYLNDAVDLLNKELADNNASTVPTIRLNYVGGHPNLTSHY